MTAALGSSLSGSHQNAFLLPSTGPPPVHPGQQQPVLPVHPGPQEEARVRSRLQGAAPVPAFLLQVGRPPSPTSLFPTSLWADASPEPHLGLGCTWEWAQGVQSGA